jgi:hypothetical protein
MRGAVGTSLRQESFVGQKVYRFRKTLRVPVYTFNQNVLNRVRQTRYGNYIRSMFVVCHCVQDL